MIKSEYKRAKDKATALSNQSRKSAKERAQASQRASFYAQLEQEDFKLQTDLAELSTEAEVRQAIMIPLYARPKEQRLAWWKNKTDNLDFWSSFFGHVGTQVDLR